MTAEPYKDAPPFSLRLGALKPQIEARIATWARRGHSNGLGPILKRDLARYYRLVDQELASLPLSTTDAEVCYQVLSRLTLLELALDNLPGLVSASAWALQHLTPGYRETLARKLVSLTPGQRTALADAIERASDTVYENAEHDTLTRLRAVGLVRE